MQARRDRREERVGGLDLAVSPYGLAHYVPGERGWIKTRNRAYLRYEMEREGALARPVAESHYLVFWGAFFPAPCLLLLVR